MVFSALALKKKTLKSVSFIGITANPISPLKCAVIWLLNRNIFGEK